MIFTAEHDDVRRSLQKFIASEINPFVDEREASGAFLAHELFKKLGDLGFLGLNNRCLPAILGRQGFLSETPVSRALIAIPA